MTEHDRWNKRQAKLRNQRKQYVAACLADERLPLPWDRWEQVNRPNGPGNGHYSH